MERKEQGLSEREAKNRLQRDGRNELKRQKGKSAFGLFWEQLQDPLIYVLVVAAAVSILLKEYSDAAIIAAVVLLNAFVGMLQEGKARKALEALESLQSPEACVIREGKKRVIPAAELVMGDLVCLETGGRVPADLRLIEAVHLSIEESALTGESLPVEKTGRGDRAFLSTLVTTGRGKGIVIGTGMHTELGKIADLIHQEKEELTPLQKRLGELGKALSILSLLLCAALFGVAVWQKRDVMQMLITAISLAVAAVPEGLPAVVTICLALSVGRMVKANTIVRKLPAVETLGAVSMVCSDKTGTLTRNRMTVEAGYWNGKMFDLSDHRAKPPRELLRAAVLCNNAEQGSGQGGPVGDPTEIGLLEFAAGYGVKKEEEEKLTPRVAEIPFSSEKKEMTTFHQSREGRLGYCKGASDVVLEKCTAMAHGESVRSLTARERREVQEAVQELSQMAYRTLGICVLQSERQGWIFLGVVALRDPVRPQVPQAVRALSGAGVQTCMITGDHAQTAYAIASRLGIAKGPEQCVTGKQLEEWSDDRLREEIAGRKLRVFARVTPTQKVRIVKAFRQNGEITAMTGDGVNDAPSLRAADIGIAMGKNGTDVARQAADMILTDDNFATIERAIEEGRGVYENIRKSVLFLLSSNLGELLTMFVSVFFGFASPLKSAHILWINLITDSLPALALGVDKNDGEELMRHPPRKKNESLFSRGGFGCTCFYGLLIAGISLTAFGLPVFSLLRDAADLTEKITILRESLCRPDFLVRGQTYAFTVLGMSQLFHAVGMRDICKSVFCQRLSDNPLMLLAFGVGFLLQLAVTEIPFLINAFGTVPLSLGEWGILTGLAAIPLLAHEAIALFCQAADPQE